VVCVLVYVSVGHYAASPTVTVERTEMPFGASWKTRPKEPMCYMDSPTPTGKGTFKMDIKFLKCNIVKCILIRMKKNCGKENACRFT